MNIFHIEGVVLDSLSFKEYDRILTVFTPLGIQKFFSKGSKRYNPLTSPFTVGEFVYNQGKKELHRLQDGSVVDQNLPIRERLESMVAAHALSSAILQSQMPDKAAPSLYRLFRLFLSALSLSPYPENLSTAFYLKVMKHEGILELQNPHSFRFGGECFAKENAPVEALEIKPVEEKLLLTLTNSRSLEEIVSFSQPEGFAKKVHLLFTQAFTAAS